MPRTECLDVLPSVPLGRMAGVVDGEPFVLPVNFALFEGDILIRTNAGTKLHAAITGSVVAFEADHFPNDGLDGWSVLIRGQAREITAAEELARAQAVELRTYAYSDSPNRFIRIPTEKMTGRRFDRM